MCFTKEQNKIKNEYNLINCQTIVSCDLWFGVWKALSISFSVFGWIASMAWD